MNKRIGWLAPVLVVLATLIVYLGADRHSRLPEDDLVVWGNDAVSGKSMSSAWLGRFYSASEDLNPAVRPAATLALRALHAAFTFDRAPLQWGLILLHSATAVLVFFLLRGVLGSATVALLGALLFAVHPDGTESVLRLAGYSDALSLLFVMLALLASRSVGARIAAGRPAAAAIAAMLGSFLLACLAKEAALAAMPALAVSLWALSGKPTDSGTAQSERKQAVIGLALAVLLVLAIRFVSLSAAPAWLRGVPTVTPMTGVSIPRRLLYGLAAGPTYLRLFFLPIDLGYSYDYLYGVKGLNLVARALVGVVMLAGLGYGTLRSAQRHSSTAMFWALAFFGIVAAMGLVVPVGDFASQRMLYPVLPAGIALFLVGYRALRSSVGKPAWDAAAIVVGLLVVGLFGVRTAVRNDDFSDWEHLVKAQAATYESSAQAHFDLGNFYLEQGLWTAAGDEYDRALVLRSDFWQAWINRGGAYFGATEVGLAMRCYQNALVGLEGKPEFASVWGKLHFNRAIILMQQDRNKEAVQGLLETVKVFPNHLRAQASLGFIYANAPAFDRESIDHLSRAIVLEKDPERARNLQAKLAEVRKRRQNINTRRGYPDDFIAGGGKEEPEGMERYQESGSPSDSTE